MKSELHYYEIYPKCFLTGEKTITIRSINERCAFESGHPYYVEILQTNRAQEKRFAGTGCTTALTVVPDDRGCLVIKANFPEESLYQFMLYREKEERRFAELRVYALARDMKGRYPFCGDLHMHTCRSDGSEDPYFVPAHYRGWGYDFTVISDHRRYYPSLEARQKFRFSDDDSSPLTDMLIVRGEEVHLPYNDVHYINFGGSFSLNALVSPNCNQEKAQDDPAWRSADGKCPDVMSKEDFMAMIEKRAKGVDRELESERLSFAVAQWEHEMVQAGGGLAIFPHPYWMCSSMQLSEDYIYYYYAHKPFDAFEVLGGERYYQHNGFQTAFYYENLAKGCDYPVVGSTDSHGSTENNINGRICSTIVFAPANTTKELIGAIKAKYSVAVDTISEEYRLVGNFRWVKFGSFLKEEWYPLHDAACAAEGYYLNEYAKGNPAAEKVLTSMKGQIPAMMAKFFDME